MISGSKCRWMGVNCVHLSAIIVNIPVSTYWDQMKQKKEAPVCIKIYIQDWFLSERYFPFLSSSEARKIFRWFYDQHNDWGCYNQHWGEHWWSSGTGGPATRFSGSMPNVLNKAPNHIALSMPDKTKNQSTWMRCDTMRCRQTTEYWWAWVNLYRGVLCTWCEPPSQSMGWHSINLADIGSRTSALANSLIDYDSRIGITLMS